MVSYSQHPAPSSYDTGFDTLWKELYPTLWSLVKRLVYSLRVPSWDGQEDDIVEDIMQETARRIIERFQKAKRGEAEPIYSFEHMVAVTACNYCKDMRRRDLRLTHFNTSDHLRATYNGINVPDYSSLSEVATDRVYQEGLFTLLAQEIVKFPNKQRRALLTDLANRMCFEAEPTPLQKAFLEVGIRLQDYQRPLTDNAKKQSRDAALLYYAYKRIAQLSYVKGYVSVV